jgi:hypothetical protein
MRNLVAWRAVTEDSGCSEGLPRATVELLALPRGGAHYHVSFARQQISAPSEAVGQCNLVLAPVVYWSWSKPLPSCERSEPFRGRTVVIGPDMAIQSNTYAIATDRQGHVLGFLRIR